MLGYKWLFFEKWGLRNTLTGHIYRWNLKFVWRILPLILITLFIPKAIDWLIVFLVNCCKRKCDSPSVFAMFEMKSNVEIWDKRSNSKFQILLSRFITDNDCQRIYIVLKESKLFSSVWLIPLSSGSNWTSGLECVNWLAKTRTPAAKIWFPCCQLLSQAQRPAQCEWVLHRESNLCKVC